MNIRQLSAVVLAASALFATAAHAGPDAALKGTQASQSVAPMGPLKLLKTWFETDVSGMAIAGGFNAYGTNFSVTCPSSAPSCTILVNANAQLAGVASANSAAVCVKVDGGYVNCPFNTVIPTTGFTVMNYQTGISVAPGAHTVSVEVYSTQATTLHRYNTEVKLYK